jgi:hypothetical protein
MDSYRTFEGNSKKEQDPGLIKRLKEELEKLFVVIDIFRVKERKLKFQKTTASRKTF